MILNIQKNIKKKQGVDPFPMDRIHWHLDPRPTAPRLFSALRPGVVRAARDDDVHRLDGKVMTWRKQRVDCTRYMIMIWWYGYNNKWTIYLPIYLSTYLSIYPKQICLYILYVYIYMYIYIYVYMDHKISPRWII